jgi:hypothetical protein
MAYIWTPAEQEVVISKCADEKEFRVYSTYPYWTRYFLDLHHQIGGRVIHHQGGTKFFLPEDSIFIGLKRKYNLSPEERARRAEHMRAVRVVNGHHSAKEEQGLA